jgi:hypothetical protein
MASTLTRSKSGSAMARPLTLLNCKASGPGACALGLAAAAPAGAESDAAGLGAALSIALRTDGSDWARLPRFPTGSVMSGSLSIRVHSPLMKGGHAQYRQLNLELEDYFHKKCEHF